MIINNIDTDIQCRYTPMIINNINIDIQCRHTPIIINSISTDIQCSHTPIIINNINTDIQCRHTPMIRNDINTYRLTKFINICRSGNAEMLTIDVLKSPIWLAKRHKTRLGLITSWL
jgi:hypothetical protein